MSLCPHLSWRMISGSVRGWGRPAGASTCSSRRWRRSIGRRGRDCRSERDITSCLLLALTHTLFNPPSSCIDHTPPAHPAARSPLFAFCLCSCGMKAYFSHGFSELLSCVCFSVTHLESEQGCCLVRTCRGKKKKTVNMLAQISSKPRSWKRWELLRVQKGACMF